MGECVDTEHDDLHMERVCETTDAKLSHPCHLESPLVLKA
jgi:hypothetical protein